MFSQDTSRRDFLLIVCASISWGTVGIANQALYTSGVTNALSLSFLRLAIATPLFFLACWTRLGRRLFRMKRRDLGVMMLMGSMIAFSQACYIAALASDGVGVSTLIAICVAPVIITVFTTCIARERLTLITLIVLVAALSGTVLLVGTRSHTGEGMASLVGTGLAFLSACGYAGFILCGRLLTGRCHPLQISAVAFGTGTLVLLVCAASTRLVLVYSAWGWLILLYLGCVPTALAYVLFDTDSYDG
ncbi:MAG TPA: EamA family transporter [Ktedonobacteraceae bacterium]|nr:EamA family transporter [Ktedonobacteraceae bacterium]